jgi:hypothetical protein
MTQDVQYPEEVRLAVVERVLHANPGKKRIYLASPYSARLKNGTPDEVTMYQRFLQVCHVAGQIMEHDHHVVFCPIAHSVPIADTMDNHLDADFWLGQDEPFLNWADEMWVLMLPGWETSKGIEREIHMAQVMGKPILYLSLTAYEHLEGT